MMNYKIKMQDNSIAELAEYRFKNEGTDPLSPQVLLSKFPQIILQMSDIDLSNREALFCCREFSTSSGYIDLLIITKDIEIIVIETKLLRNPESTRNVVAQAIDYIKSLAHENFLRIEAEILRMAASEEVRNRLSTDDFFRATLQTNFRTGNFKVLIIGDHIHPNVLGMVDSIQSAPHLGFTIQLVELNIFQFDHDHLVLSPKVVANTTEVERSVIRITIHPESTPVLIESAIPSAEGKGNRPRLSWEQFTERITVPGFIPVIQNFRDQWILEVDDSISMGQVGFSAGFFDGTKRQALQFVYPNRVALLSLRYAKSIGIQEGLYSQYKEEIRKSSRIFDTFLVGNRVEIPFEKLSVEDLSLILQASLKLARTVLGK